MMLKPKNLIVKKRENSRRYIQILKNEGESSRVKKPEKIRRDSRRRGKPK